MTKKYDLESEGGLATLLQVFRYSQVGRCVNSVTHDVNNMLGAVMAYAELVEMDKAIGAESRRMLGEVVEAARKCSVLVNGLTSVARKEKVDATLVEADQLLTRVLDLRRYDLRVNQTALQEEYEAHLPSVVVDRPKLEQTIIYLVTNAMEVLESAAVRRIRVRVSRGDKALEIAVWNSGEPVPEADREVMFEPFFTTKGPGHFGMGLYLARQYMGVHEGQITYSPEQGFVLTVPFQNSLSKQLQEQE